MKRLEREPGAPHLTFRVLALAQKQVAPGSGIPEVAASGIFTSGHLALRELTLPTYKLKRVRPKPELNGEMTVAKERTVEINAKGSKIRGVRGGHLQPSKNHGH